MFLMKICLLGDGAVGKTALRENYLGKNFSSAYLMTIGADYAVAKVELSNKKIAKFQIWDLAGQERFNSVRSLYYAGSHGAIMIFDVTRQYTFTNLEGWLKELKKNLRSGLVPIILLGNKIDLRDIEDSNHLVYTQGVQLAKKLSESYSGESFSIKYMETSAKTGENVKKAFTLLADSIAAESITFSDLEDERENQIEYHTNIIIENIFGLVTSLENYLKSKFRLKEGSLKWDVKKIEILLLISENKTDFLFFLDTKNLEFAFYDFQAPEEKIILLRLIITLAEQFEDWSTNYYERGFQLWIYLLLEFLLLKAFSESLNVDNEDKDVKIFRPEEHIKILIKCYYFFKQKNSKRSKTLELILIMVKEFLSYNIKDTVQNEKFNNIELFQIYEEITENRDIDVKTVINEIKDYAKDGHISRFKSFKQLFVEGRLDFVFNETQKEAFFHLLKGFKSLISPIHIKFSHILRNYLLKDEIIEIELQIENTGNLSRMLEIQLKVLFLGDDKLSLIFNEFSRNINIKENDTNITLEKIKPKGKGLHILQLSTCDVKNNYFQYHQAIVSYRGDFEFKHSTTIQEQVKGIWSKNLENPPEFDLLESFVKSEILKFYDLIIKKNENLDSVYQMQIALIFHFFFLTENDEIRSESIIKSFSEHYKVDSEYLTVALTLIKYKLSKNFFSPKYEIEYLLCKLGIIIEDLVKNPPIKSPSDSKIQIINDSLKILFVKSNPRGKPSLRIDTEIIKIRKCIKGLDSKFRDKIQFEVRSATRNDINLLLTEFKPQILHFTGHGDSQGNLYFFRQEDEMTDKISQDEFIGLLKTYNDVIRLVVLNACETYTLAENLSKYINNVVAMSEEVADNDAIVFSENFYLSICTNESILTSVDRAKGAMTMMKAESNIVELFSKPNIDPKNQILLN
ncbi:MAG: Transforming protein p29 precursor [Candidatus Heimdallarchaeota archaeon LC_3]|nr:MAG: Transforming protein p29 precursor [Candidatus Heimdallarchaeota archaeon LC_3]